MGSLYSNGFHIQQISVRQLTFGLGWKERFTSWMCTRQICSNWDAIMSILTKISEECLQDLCQSTNIYFQSTFFTSSNVCCKSREGLRLRLRILGLILIPKRQSQLHLFTFTVKNRLKCVISRSFAQIYLSIHPPSDIILMEQIPYT